MAAKPHACIEVSSNEFHDLLNQHFICKRKMLFLHVISSSSPGELGALFPFCRGVTSVVRYRGHIQVHLTIFTFPFEMHVKIRLLLTLYLTLGKLLTIIIYNPHDWWSKRACMCVYQSVACLCCSCSPPRMSAAPPEAFEPLWPP